MFSVPPISHNRYCLVIEIMNFRNQLGQELFSMLLYLHDTISETFSLDRFIRIACQCKNKQNLKRISLLLYLFYCSRVSELICQEYNFKTKDPSLPQLWVKQFKLYLEKNHYLKKKFLNTIFNHKKKNYNPRNVSALNPQRVDKKNQKQINQPRKKMFYIQ